MLSLRISNYQLLGIALTTGVLIVVVLFFMISVMSTPRDNLVEKPPIMIDFLAWQKTVIPVRRKSAPPTKFEPGEKKQKPRRKNFQSVIPNVRLEQAAEKNSPSSITQRTQTLIPEHKIMAENQDQTVKEFLPDPVPFFKLTESPQFLHREIPGYPESMRATGRKGFVILSVLIDKSGKVRKVTVLKSGGEYFDRAAIKGMKASSFIPAKIDGKAVAVLLRMPVEFRLL